MNKKLRICHIGWAHSIHVERLMRWFAKKGHDISIITDKPKEIDGVKIYVIPKSFNVDARTRWKRYMRLSFNDYRLQKIRHQLLRVLWIRNIVKEINPDIIHSHSLWYPGYLGAYINGFPFVLTVLNGDVLWKKDDIGSKIKLYDKIRTKYALKKANMVTGESETLINACMRRGVSKKKLHVTRCGGIDLTKFNCNEDKSEIRNSLGFSNYPKLVLSPRNITTNAYNIDKIIKAIPRVINQLKEVLFVFIWHAQNSDRENMLRDLILKLGIQENVKIVGSVTHDKIVLYHKASDIMVSVSQYDSGPVALQEAMACGDVPVISDLPSVREWITDDWNGILVDPNNVDQIADSIIDLLQNDTKRKRFSEINWKMIQEKGDEKYWMGKMEGLYYSLVK